MSTKHIKIDSAISNYIHTVVKVNYSKGKCGYRWIFTSASKTVQINWEKHFKWLQTKGNKKKIVISKVNRIRCRARLMGKKTMGKELFPQKYIDIWDTNLWPVIANVFPAGQWIF
jgi:hypothetical protein